MDTLRQPWVKRLAACLFGGLVLALMVGNQEGTNTGDFGIAFFQAMGLRSTNAANPAFQFPWRAILFLAIGGAIYVGMTFWGLARPYLRRPGVLPLGAGLIGVIISQGVMNWYDNLLVLRPSDTNSRFLTLKSVVDSSGGLQAYTQPFFDWLSWILMALAFGLGAAAVVVRIRPVGYAAGAVGLVGAVLAWLAHADVASVGGGIDHSLGVYVDVLAFLSLAAGGLFAVLSTDEVADPKGFLNRLLTWRPGFALVSIGVVFGLFAYIRDCWYAPLTRNADLSTTHSLFSGSSISSLGSAYLGWLGWLLFAAAAVGGVACTYLQHKLLAWATAGLGLVGVVTTFFTLKSMTFTGFSASPNDGQRWGNVGVGGYMACLVFALFGAAALQVLLSGPRPEVQPKKPWTKDLPFSAAVLKVRNSAQAKTLIVVGVAFALFYPPMATVTWQNVLVTQIGVYVLLAVGLNVVVGWAGLLDLGYIAFYGIGSYTTAYITGRLPIKPPSWLHFTPLLAIPFAIGACLIAGVLLGAPTLRLRGDYLAIVTLGFGEIVEVLAQNNAFNITGGPIGPTVPHPKVRIGPLHITWGEDNLPYWYLLLVLLAIVLILFHRLEGSRLGRAWAAIREDEVAAQASGVNTTRAKLLAFAIGASTSGLAGFFFATQVGYFDPTLFTLQASILIVAYVVFGGMGSLPGAMAGAAVLTWLPQFLKGQVPANDRQMWVGAAVLAMMIFRPAGLLPAKRRKAELEGLDSPASAEVAAIPASEGL